MTTNANALRKVVNKPAYEDVDVGDLRRGFTDGRLYDLYRRRVLDSDNDFVVVVAAASKSAVSGVGKTTLAVSLARYFDNTKGGFNAEQKATLDPKTFAHNLLTDEETVPDQSAVIFDEAQGTLSSSGADARRSMADSVMDVTTAISTLRFRQVSCLIVSQSTKWIDKRIDDVLDALILIQDWDGDEARAEVFTTYYNDLETSPTRYTEHLDTITWPVLPEDDPDYSYLHELKRKSALEQGTEEEEEDKSLPKEDQIRIAQDYRDKGMTIKEIASSPLIDYKKSWVSEHTEAPGNDD